MAPHYDRHAEPSAEQNASLLPPAGGEAMADAAEAVRQAEIDAVQPDVPDVSSLDPAQLDSLNIDDLRVVAKELEVPDRSTITEKDELIAAIRLRL